MSEGVSEYKLTWYVLDDVGHKGAEVAADVSQGVRVLVVLRLKQLTGKVYVLQQGPVQGVAFPVQTPTRSVHTTTNTTTNVRALNMNEEFH